MTYEEALLFIADTCHKCKLGNCAECVNIPIKNALELCISKKFEIWNGQDCCPTCKAVFGSDETRKHLISWKMDYCKYCGQALDWSDDE